MLVWAGWCGFRLIALQCHGCGRSAMTGARRRSLPLHILHRCFADARTRYGSCITQQKDMGADDLIIQSNLRTSCTDVLALWACSWFGYPYILSLNSLQWRQPQVHTAMVLCHVINAVVPRLDMRLQAARHITAQLDQL